MTDALPAFAHNLGKTLEELLRVSDVLTQDIENLALVYKDDWTSQSFRRIFVRSSWALIEGELYGVKQFTLRACELGGKNVSLDEHRILSERQILVGDSGAAQLKHTYSDTLSNIKSTLKIAVTKFELDWVPDFGTQGWQNLSSSLELRHRITHPKSMAELIFSDGELDIHRYACVWYEKNFNEFLASLVQKYS